MEDLIERIRGDAGATVRLKLSRKDQHKRHTVIVEIPRAPIDIAAIKFVDPEPINRVYNLERFAAEEAAEAIRTILGRKATVMPDARMNRIIIKADAETHELAQKMIEQMDAAE